MFSYLRSHPAGCKHTGWVQGGSQPGGVRGGAPRRRKWRFWLFFKQNFASRSPLPPRGPPSSFYLLYQDSPVAPPAQTPTYLPSDQSPPTTYPPRRNLHARNAMRRRARWVDRVKSPMLTHDGAFFFFGEQSFSHPTHTGTQGGRTRTESRRPKAERVSRWRAVNVNSHLIRR